MWWVKAKHKIRIRDARQDRQPEIHSTFVREDLQRIMGQTNKDCRLSDLHFDKFSTPATFAYWKIRFKTEVCTCSPFPTEALHVDQGSGDGWISGWFSNLRALSEELEWTRFWGTRRENCFSTEPNHPLYTAFKKKGSLEEHESSKRGSLSSEEDRSLTWSTNTSGSLRANDSVENYPDLFTIVLRNDDIQEFDSKWDGILLSMMQIPSDEILESLYK